MNRRFSRSTTSHMAPVSRPHHSSTAATSTSGKYTRAPWLVYPERFPASRSVLPKLCRSSNTSRPPATRMRRATGFRRGLSVLILLLILNSFAYFRLRCYSRKNHPSSATTSRHPAVPAALPGTPRPSFQRILPASPRGQFVPVRRNREAPNKVATLRKYEQNHPAKYGGFRSRHLEVLHFSLLHTLFSPFNPPNNVSDSFLQFLDSFFQPFVLPLQLFVFSLKFLNAITHRLHPPLHTSVPIARPAREPSRLISHRSALGRYIRQCAGLFDT